MKQVAARKMLVLGLQHFTAYDLRAVKAAKQKLQIRVLGLATIAKTLLLNWPWPPLPLWTCWARCMRARR